MTVDSLEHSKHLESTQHMLHHNPSLGEGFILLALLSGQSATPPTFVRGFAFGVLLRYALISPVAQQFYLGSQS